MLKDNLIDLLSIIERECKRGCEQSYYEQDRDVWSKHHEYIRQMRLDLKNGRFK
jgi:hypothetical protein